ncbi:MAG: preprotein translocase subunit SecE [Gemmatimonadales bacterium]
MATAQVERTGLVGHLQRTMQFLVAVNLELKKITWPTRTELIETTKRITILAIAIGVLIGIMDWVLQKILVDGVAAIAR